MRDNNLTPVVYPLWITYAFIPIAAGLDKFTNLLVDWDQYIAPFARDLLPISGDAFMYIVGAIEIAVGILALTKLRRLAAYVASAWLALIAVNLLLSGWYDIAVRDLAMSAGAFTLGQLLGVMGEAVVPGRAAATGAVPARVHVSG
jgi:hypothetical protein